MQDRRVLNLMQALHTGRVDRRGFLRRAAALGVSAPVAMGLLGSVPVVGAQDATPAATSDFDWKRESGKTIYPILVEHPYTDAMEPFFPEFEELTGITVKYEKLPETQFREKLLLALSTGAGTYDVFMTGYIDDFRYVGGGWIEPLDSYINDPTLTDSAWDFADFFESLINVNRWDGTAGAGVGEGSLWALPVNEEGYALMYRKDILEAQGIEVPKTYDELLAAAEKLNGIDFEGQKVAGFVARGDRTWPTITTGYGSVFWSYGGEVMDVDAWKSTVNNEAGVAATDYWGKLMKFAPEGVTGFTWYEAMQSFMNGSAAMFIDADHMAGSIEDPTASKVAGKAGYAIPPEGPGGVHTNIWIWSLGLASAAKEKNAAWLFMQWATSKKILTDSAVKNNINPTRTSAANDPTVLEYMKGWGDYSAVYQELINEYSRVMVPALPEFAQVGDVWAQSVQEVVLGQKDAKTAMDEAAAAMDKVLATIKPA
jgi:multiple sugar transport system substrate-binding protein